MSILRCAITDRSLYGHSEADRQAGLLEQAQTVAASEVDFLQVREKDLSAKQLVDLTRLLMEALRAQRSVSGHETRLLVNSRVDVAAAAGADGVHLTSGDGQLTPGQARLVLDRECDSEDAPIVSVACHTLDEVKRARHGGADFILFGPVFGKWDEGKLVVPGVGLDALSSACISAGSVPVLALGGITAQNSAECVAAGAAGIAGIRLFR
jgi:thiamine-phosphate pyrophosphorylase